MYRAAVRRLLPFVLSAGVGVASFSCGITIVPAPDQGGQVDATARLVVKEANGIQVAVQSMAWRYDPYYLEDYFTPLLVFIRNKTDAPVSISYDNFVLVDDRGNQFNAVGPQVVDRAVRHSGYGAGYGYPPPYYPPAMNAPFPPYGYEPYSYRYADVLMLALQETKVVPHAQVRGFVYFQEATVEGKQLTVTVSLAGTSQEFHFTIKR
jgi:hypothetical protein